MINEVASFARDYINKPAYRTTERKAKIRAALKQLTGEIVVISCGTCYIEALYKILKRTTMATSNYELRKGVVLQVFGDPTKTCTNLTLTDALAKWYLKYYPEKAIYFTRRPAPEVPVIPPSITIITPEVKEPEVIIPKVEAKSDVVPGIMAKTLSAIADIPPESPVVKKTEAPVVKKPVKRKTHKTKT